MSLIAIADGSREADSSQAVGSEPIGASWDAAKDFSAGRTSAQWQCEPDPAQAHRRRIVDLLEGTEKATTRVQICTVMRLLTLAG